MNSVTCKAFRRNATLGRKRKRKNDSSHSVGMRPGCALALLGLQVASLTGCGYLWGVTCRYSDQTILLPSDASLTGCRHPITALRYYAGGTGSVPGCQPPCTGRCYSFVVALPRAAQPVLRPNNSAPCTALFAGGTGCYAPTFQAEDCSLTTAHCLFPITY